MRRYSLLSFMRGPNWGKEGSPELPEIPVSRAGGLQTAVRSISPQQEAQGVDVRSYQPASTLPPHPSPQPLPQWPSPPHVAKGTPAELLLCLPITTYSWPASAFFQGHLSGAPSPIPECLT